MVVALVAVLVITLVLVILDAQVAVEELVVAIVIILVDEDVVLCVGEVVVALAQRNVEMVVLVVKVRVHRTA